MHRAPEEPEAPAEHHEVRVVDEEAEVLQVREVLEERRAPTLLEKLQEGPPQDRAKREFLDIRFHPPSVGPIIFERFYHVKGRGMALSLPFRRQERP